MGDSIELRPPKVNERLEFGHWEIDLMLGRREKDEVLLTLDERMTRFRHIIRLPKIFSNYVRVAIAIYHFFATKVYPKKKFCMRFFLCYNPKKF